MKVELIYEKTCPNIKAARMQLAKAFTQSGLQPSWQEWEVSDPDAPAYARIYGSPTILVNEQDVSGLAPGDCKDNCRIYSGDDGNLGVVPPLEKIVNALRETGETHARD